MIPPLVIRADADGRIGAGHVMRTLALAQAWRSHGGGVRYVSRCESEPIRRRVLDSGAKMISLDRVYPDSRDAELTRESLREAAALADGGCPWLVLDGYHFDPAYHQAVSSEAWKVLLFDDTAELARYDVDAVLNQNLHAERLSYPPATRARLLLGTRYALLRPEFLSWRNAERDSPPVARRLLVTLGGADPDNVTRKVLEALTLVDDPSMEVRVVVGPANPHLDDLREVAARGAHAVELHHSVTDMPGMMRWADVAISAGGSTCWELAFMGLPSLVIVVADNQRGIAAGLAEEGAAVSLGWHADLAPPDIARSVRSLADDAAARQRMTARGRRLVDGCGGDRLVRELLPCA